MLRSMTTVVSVGFLSMLCQTSNADVLYDVNLDTAPLIGHAAGPFTIFLALTDGSGIGDANNTVTLSNLDFGGGSAAGNAVGFGGVTGALETSLSLTDSSFLNLFFEGFTPGDQLNFTLDLTSNDDVGGTPDRLTISILDSSGARLPTLAPIGDYFLGVDLHSTGPVFDLWGSNPGLAPSAGGDAVAIPAPVVTAVPEPAAGVLLCLALMAVFAQRHNSARR